MYTSANNDYYSKTRRNLILICLSICFYKYSGSRIESFTTAGAKITIGDPSALIDLSWLIFTYILIRFKITYNNVGKKQINEELHKYYMDHVFDKCIQNFREDVNLHAEETIKNLKFNFKLKRKGTGLSRLINFEYKIFYLNLTKFFIKRYNKSKHKINKLSNQPTLKINLFNPSNYSLIGKIRRGCQVNNGILYFLFYPKTKQSGVNHYSKMHLVWELTISTKYLTTERFLIYTEDYNLFNGFIIYIKTVSYLLFNTNIYFDHFLPLHIALFTPIYFYYSVINKYCSTYIINYIHILAAYITFRP